MHALHNRVFSSDLDLHTQSPCQTMKTCSLFRGLAHLSTLALFACVCTMANGATIFQSSGSSYIAFQGESVSSILAGTPTSWVITNDATANGGKAIYQAGANQTGSSSSFAYYSLNFAQAGTYSTYYRWRADK